METDKELNVKVDSFIYKNSNNSNNNDKYIYEKLNAAHIVNDINMSTPKMFACINISQSQNQRHIMSAKFFTPSILLLLCIGLRDPIGLLTPTAGTVTGTVMGTGVEEIDVGVPARADDTAELRFGREFNFWSRSSRSNLCRICIISIY